MYEQLVEEVIEEVLRRISIRPCSNQDSKKETCLVLGELTEDLKHALDKKYCVVQRNDVTGELPESIMEQVSHVTLILVTKLSISNLCNLASGNCVTVFEEYLSDGLLLGKKIIIIETALKHRAYKATSSPNYYRKLLEHERTLLSYGIKIKSEPELFFCSNENLRECIENYEVPPDGVLINRTLITEKELLASEVGQASKVLIPKRSIITPMAMDYLREHNLKLIRQ